MAAATIGESGIDALFFDRVGVQALPVMYLLQGGVTLIAMFALTGILEKTRSAGRARYAPGQHI